MTTRTDQSYGSNPSEPSIHTTNALDRPCYNISTNRIRDKNTYPSQRKTLITITTTEVIDVMGVCSLLRDMDLYLIY